MTLDDPQRPLALRRGQVYADAAELAPSGRPQLSKGDGIKVG